ncbi:multidrug efflux MFS transporter Bmr3 [soil metagenome]
MAEDKEKQADSEKDKSFDKSSSLEPTESHALNDKANSRITSSGWKTLAILGSTILITMYGETMLLPAIPDIIKEFNISYSTSSWILTSYLIAGAVMTPIGGKLSDIYGRKKIVLIIMIIYIIGISLGGLASDVTFLIISRIIQGIGIAMFPIAFGIVRDQFPPEKLAIGIGTFSAMFAAGSVVGLAIGGTIIQNFGWRVTFFSIIPVSFMLWFVIKKFIYDTQYRSPSLEFSSSVKPGTPGDDDILEHNIQGSTKAPNRHIPNDRNSPDVKVVNVNSFTRSIDIKGAITLAITITSFLIVLSYLDTGISNNDIGSDQILGRDNATSNTAPPQIVVGFLSVGTISLTIFIITERKANTPLIDFKLIANRMILASNILLLISFLSMFTVYQTIPFLVRSPAAVGGFGGDPIATANIQLPFMVVFLVFAPFSGFIISKLGKIKPTFIGSVIAAIGFFSIFIMHSTPALVAGTLAIIATGLSLIQVGAFNIVLESTPRHLSGTSLGTTVLLNLIGGAVGPAIAGIIMQTNQVTIAGSNVTVGSFPSPQSYYLIFLITALLSLVSIILVLIIKKTTPMKLA